MASLEISGPQYNFVAERIDWLMTIDRLLLEELTLLPIFLWSSRSFSQSSYFEPGSRFIEANPGASTVSVSGSKNSRHLTTSML